MDLHLVAEIVSALLIIAAGFVGYGRLKEGQEIVRITLDRLGEAFDKTRITSVAQVEQTKALADLTRERHEAVVGRLDDLIFDVRNHGTAIANAEKAIVRLEARAGVVHGE